MPLLFISGALALVSVIVGGLCWLLIRLTGRRGHLRQTLKWTGVAYLVLLPLVVLVALPVVASQFLAHASTRPMDQHLTQDPATYGRPFEDVSFPSSDGVVLRGWYLPGKAGRSPFVFCHGLFRDRHEVLERSCRLNEMGFPALLFDFRGHGHSDPAPITLGYMEQFDVIAAADQLRSRTGASKIALCGVSMGAAAVVLAAAQDPGRIQSLVADSPFASLERTVEHHAELLLGFPAVPFSRVFLWNFCRIGHFEPNSVNVIEAASKLDHVPVLLIYGNRDRRMPRSVAEAVYAAIPGADKRLLFVEGADHGAAYREAPQVYLDAVEAFLAPEE